MEKGLSIKFLFFSYLCPKIKQKSPLKNGNTSRVSFRLEGINPIEFFGVADAKLNKLKENFPEVQFIARGNKLVITGKKEDVSALSTLILSMLQEIETLGTLSDVRFGEMLAKKPEEVKPKTKEQYKNEEILKAFGGKIIRAKTEGQAKMFELAKKNPIVFAIGPAGTGKTYTAVAIAVRYLKNKSVKKIVLARPAVEAGESLGFLPGDMKEKVDPYLRPLYDALEEMLPPQQLEYYMENNIIEIVPLAFMRGRSLNNSFILLDEAQNATDLQLKMFLTRMGQNSRIIITGDPSQIDLKKNTDSGLMRAITLLSRISGIALVRLHERDVLRHPLVKEIIKAYDEAEK